MSLTTGVEDPSYQGANQSSAPPAPRGLTVVPLAAVSVLALVITSVGVGIAVPRLGAGDDRPLAVMGALAVVVGGTAALRS